MANKDAFRARTTARRLAKRLPVLSRYERRLAELNSANAALTAAQQVPPAAVAANPAEFVPPGHFYSAIPDPAAASARYATLEGSDPTQVPGVDLRLERQWRVLSVLESLLPDMPFGDEPRDGLRYGFVNGAYSFGDATMLHLMLRWIQPKRLIEVGSGHSSACTLDTVDRFLGGRCEVTFIEPFDQLLRSLLHPDDFDRVLLRPQPVQEVPLDVFEALDDGDVLFIDSTHVSKVGSDVNYLLFEVLPSLKPGVVIHIHDVFPGFEYPWAWVQQGRVWTEDYLLRAFLQFNEEFEILLWPVLLTRIDPEGVIDRFPTLGRNPGGSLYLRRRGGRSLV